MNGVFPEAIETDCINHTFCAFTSPHHSNVSIENYALIELGHDGMNYINTGWRLEYLSPMHLDHVSPPQGSLLGDFEVKIVGINFHSNIQHNCIISHSDIKIKNIVAEVINETHLSCIMPPIFLNQSSFPVSVQVSRLNEDLSMNSLRFVYTDYHELSHLIPSVVSEVENPKVTMFGRNFDKSKTLTCMFLCQNGEQKFELAVVRSVKAVECVAPHMAIGTSILCITSTPPKIERKNGLKIDVVEGKHTMSNETYQKDAPKAESRNMTDVRPSVPSYSVIENIGNELNDITIVQVYPTSGPSRGGTTFYWFGYNFNKIWNLTCNFGTNKFVKAEVKNESVVECISPSQRLDLWKEKADKLQINVNLMLRNSKSYQLIKAINFEYYGEERITHIQPKIGRASGHTLVRIIGTGFKRRNSS